MRWQRFTGIIMLIGLFFAFNYTAENTYYVLNAVVNGGDTYKSNIAVPDFIKSLSANEIRYSKVVLNAVQIIINYLLCLLLIYLVFKPLISIKTFSVVFGGTLALALTAIVIGKVSGFGIPTVGGKNLHVYLRSPVFSLMIVAGMLIFNRLNTK